MKEKRKNMQGKKNQWWEEGELEKKTEVETETF